MPGRFGNGAAAYSFWQGNKRLKKRRPAQGGWILIVKYRKIFAQGRDRLGLFGKY